MISVQYNSIEAKSLNYLNLLEFKFKEFCKLIK